MSPIRDYQRETEENEPFSFSSGFSLAVGIVLLMFMIIIIALVTSYYKTTNAASARLVYQASQAKAIEFAAGDYHVPKQADLLELIGEDINQGAKIEVIDENLDANIDYIIYQKDGWITTYSPGSLEVEREK